MALFLLEKVGPARALSACANGWPGAPIEAPDEAQTGRLREESNEEWRPKAPFPSGCCRNAPALCCKASPGSRPGFVLRLAQGHFGRATHMRIRREPALNCTG